MTIFMRFSITEDDKSKILAIDQPRRNPQHQQRARQHHAGQDVQRRIGAVGQVLDPANQKGADEAGHLAQGVDQRQPAGGAALPRKAVGNGQNIDRPASAPMVARVRPSMDNQTTPPLLAASSKPATPINSGNTTCQRRSPRRSPERPTQTMKKQAARYGSALSQPMAPAF